MNKEQARKDFRMKEFDDDTERGLTTLMWLMALLVIETLLAQYILFG